MTTTKKQRGRLGIFGFMVAGLLAVVAGLLTGVGTASAHHPVLTASVSCDGTVSWTATAWMPGDGNTLQRTNPEVHVYYQNNGVVSDPP